MMLSSSKRGCINHPDNFCYVCGEYTPPAHRVKLNSRIRHAYKHYFACQVGDQDKKWAPHICCNRCRTSLLFWLDGKRKQMPFAVPMVWREQSDHVTDCYFCMMNIKGFFRKNKSEISNPICRSAIKPVSHDPDLPVPQPHTEKEDTLSVNEGASTSTESDEDLIESDPSFQNESAPLLINQERLNDLVRDLYLSKENAEVLGSRLQQWNLLEQGTTISSFHIRNQSLARYYASAKNICYCKDIEGLMIELGCEHNPAQWRLFIDSSKTSLKAVLLHNGNIKPSIPVGYSILRKETYDTMKILLDILEYPKYNWKICSDLKILFLLLGLQLGYTKNMCFLCLWNSREDSSHYAVKV